MTTDQILHLLAICAWPVVAMIAGIAFVHGIRLLIEIRHEQIRQLEQWRKSLMNLHGYWSHVYWKRCKPDTPRNELAETCEHAIITILQANGGFPGAQGDDTTRQMVREIRKMFAEIDRPTPEPEPRLREQGTVRDEIGSPFETVDDDEGYGDELDDVEEGRMYGS